MLRVVSSTCLATIGILLVGCNAQNSQPTATSSSSAANTKNSIQFTAPDGFEENKEKKLYYHPKLRASIHPAFEAGASFEAKSAEFTKENLKAENVDLTEHALKEIAGRKTLVVKGNRIGGNTPQVMSIVLFPTKNGVVQLMAIYPAGLDSESQTQIDNALLTAKYVE